MGSSTDSAIVDEFNLNLGTRYQMVLAKMHDFMVQSTITFSTVAGQQYYHYPAGLTNVETVVVTIGQVRYPTTVVNSQWQWDWLNALQVQPTAIPQFIFPRKTDFGLYPIPQATYTMTFNYHYRDRNLTVPDYIAGTVDVTHDSTSVSGTGTVFIPSMVGEFFEVTSTTAPGQGYFYKIVDVPNGTTLTLDQAYEGSTLTGLSYRIGQCPEIPDEGHICLVDGATADFYAGTRHDVETATWYNNKFWTGDGQNSTRDVGKATAMGGVIGLYNEYADRNIEHVIDRNKHIYPFLDQIWGMRLS